MVTQAVSQEFKKTDLGLIPEDWTVISFGDLVTYTKGFAFKSADYKSCGVRILRVSDTNSSSICDKDEIYLDEEQAKQYSNWTLHEDDLVISTVGSKPPMYDSIVGRVVIIDKKHEGMLLNQNAVLIRARKTSKCKQLLLLNNFRSQKYINFIETIFRGNANQASITLNDLFNFQLALPTDEDEQSAVAQVLSDNDSLVESLDRLIEKKKSIKQGAMQELLTGKKRLTGYNETWEIRKLGTECDLITKGTTPTSFGKAFKTSGINFVKIEALEENGNILKENLDFIDEDTNMLLKRSILKENDILISIAGALGRVAIVTKEILPGNTNQALSICRLKKDAEINVKYLFYFLKSSKIKKYFDLVSVQGAQANLSLENISNLNIECSSLSEQVAIAQVLSDMDSEIKVFEQKRDKYKQLKVGLMQQLLTGRIRLKCKS